MTVCTYYLRGACKYGERCRNEHPGASGNFGNQTWTSGNSSDNRAAVAYTLETITADVTPLKDKPIWPLSSYGPSKHEPVIISGLDESPEELRVKAVSALKAGTTDEYMKYEAGRTEAAEHVYANARNNARQFYEQALKVSSQVESSGSAGPSAMVAAASSVFGTGPKAPAFGGATSSTFGKPAFGQPTFGQTGFAGTASGTSAFGQGTQGTSSLGTPLQQASALSQPSQTSSAFGQPTQTSTSAFGQSAQTGSVFGQPSAFAMTTQPTSAFSQPSTQPTSVFGKPSQPTSAFGQPSQPTSAFAQPAQPAQAFNQPSQPTSSFGQTSQPAFGQSSLIKPGSGAFGGSGGGGFSAFASQPSSFASAATPSSSTMETTPSQSAFGTTPAVQSAFGTASTVPKSVFGMGQPSPLGTTSHSLTVPAMTSPVNSVSMGSGTPFASSPMTVTPSTEKPVPGAPDFASAKLAARMKPGADRYLNLVPPDYNEMIPVDVKVAFSNAKFEWGKVPDWIPPEEVR